MLLLLVGAAWMLRCRCYAMLCYAMLSRPWGHGYIGPALPVRYRPSSTGPAPRTLYGTLDVLYFRPSWGVQEPRSALRRHLGRAILTTQPQIEAAGKAASTHQQAASSGEEAIERGEPALGLDDNEPHQAGHRSPRRLRSIP